MKRVFNFGAGPAMLPEEVLRQAQSEMLDWHGTGMSIMELGHRGEHFKKMAEQAEADLRELMMIPDSYRVLFLSGGASTQFAMVPLNLFHDKKIANYIDTGIWSKKAITEAKRYGQVHIAAQSYLENGVWRVPEESAWNLHADAAYVHFTPNETIEGIEIHATPQTGSPLVADMTSVMLSKIIDVNHYGVIYAGAQKNISHAGLTIVIIHEDLLRELMPPVPTLYSYQLHADNHSFYNTPPTYAWYMAGLVFAWMKQKGGVTFFAESNQRKSKLLYQVIDQHPAFYKNAIHPSCRSTINIPFNLKNDDLTTLFLEEAAKNNLSNLKGHRLLGGVRASIYNAMPESGVLALADFMRYFAKKYGS